MFVAWLRDRNEDLTPHEHFQDVFQHLVRVYVGQRLYVLHCNVKVIDEQEVRTELGKIHLRNRLACSRKSRHHVRNRNDNMKFSVSI